MTGATGFQIGLSGANPLVRTWAPTIDSELQGGMSCKGLFLQFSTDGFPSHGIRVLRDGKAVDTTIVWDASSIPAEGFEGAINVAAGLTSMGTAQGGHAVLAPGWEQCDAESPPPGAYPSPDDTTSVPP